MPDSRWFGQMILRLRTLFQRNRVERELEEEFQFHIEQRVELEIARGLSPEEARSVAFRAMDGSSSAKRNAAIRGGSTTSMTCCAISGMPAAICAEAIAKPPQTLSDNIFVREFNMIFAARSKHALSTVAAFTALEFSLASWPRDSSRRRRTGRQNKTIRT